MVRRLGVPGYFDYQLSKADVQQCIALLNLTPEAISPRMKTLESGLTGDRRMVTYTDADAMAEKMDGYAGIGGVRLWKVPLLAEVYRVAMEKQAQRDPMFAFWYFSRWAIMDAGNDMANKLAIGRWRHLRGQFDDDQEDDIQARGRCIWPSGLPSSRSPTWTSTSSCRKPTEYAVNCGLPGKSTNVRFSRCKS